MVSSGLDAILMVRGRPQADFKRGWDDAPG
jgi:hypothetical protein